ncbi:efflux RND transporter permease subunit [Puniceicoccus vermicola]|uniref:Multidrug efflux RND transporter permease subunit n=1 Tax=Puniceicoccus vermicola TaxID=388746 RepID=A0A7X1AWI2_9BACT|nr:multidrug efflux RND transporter permease subunit [Puniceicoccus vermicola]MBC2601283.1 multidrug efflux RND transporter permease subunit [Puniceicoccus vermicola]
MFSRFFIDRPVFATVLSIVIILAGVASMVSLPISQYPEIVPPEVSVSARYPGANANTISETVASPLEQQINGVDDMIYIRSTASDDGSLGISVTFEVGTDPDQNTINVNNRVQAALSQLPEEVQRQGVTVRKQSSTILQVVNLFSPDGQYQPLFLSNYALLNVLDELKRVKGVGDASLFGQLNYSMRVWLRPDKLAEYDMTPVDVSTAIREQNSQFAAGKFGAEPSSSNPAFTYTVTTPGRLVDKSEFEDIILRSDDTGGILRLGDVARIELGSQAYSQESSLNGQPAVAMGIYLQPGANALSTAEAVRNRLEELSKTFPTGVEFAIPFDTTRFVDVAVEGVIHTFVEACLLVILVVFIFLQSWRATLIPLLAVPISIIGTFAGMSALGFSINLLTLFGLILAIGIVVDDAIIVLENVERIMRTEKKSPRDAAIAAMKEVTGPVIAIVLVLCAVFVPVAFIGGLAGEMYRQFAITIAISVIISGFVALTLTPVLSALFLKEDHSEPKGPFRLFNRGFDWITDRYVSGVTFFLKHWILGLSSILIFLGAAMYLWQKVPSSLVPEEDQGYVIAFQYLMPGTALNRTLDVSGPFTEAVMENPAVEDIITITGLDLATRAGRTNAAVSFIPLKDWDERKAESLQAANVANQLTGVGMGGFPDALIFVVNAPPITGLSSTGGFEGYIQNRVGASPEEMAGVLNEFIAAASEREELSGMRSAFNASVPQYQVTVDREKARSMGVKINDIFTTMQSTFGSLYVNDFTLYGRSYQVTIQAEGDFRESPEDLRNVFVRSANGRMVPLYSLLSFEKTVGPDVIERFNLFPAGKIQGAPAPGYSSGQALEAMEELAAEVLPEGYTLAWTGQAYQERASANTSTYAFAFGIVMIFLILAAQYEQWSLPFAVITAVPYAIFGAIALVFIRGLEIDIYFQISLLVLTGLAAKNAILIVEFAVMKRKEGMSRRDAAIEGAKLRFRPIVMTSLAFILGVVPLAVSSGAGAASRHSIGTGVIGGMLAATFISILFVPLFYRLIDRAADHEKVIGEK